MTWRSKTPIVPPSFNCMNCIELFLSQAKERPRAMALWTPESGSVSFGELLEMARRKQRVLGEYRLKPGESVLIVDSLGPRLYAQVIAILCHGCNGGVGRALDAGAQNRQGVKPGEAAFLRDSLARASVGYADPLGKKYSTLGKRSAKREW